MRTIFGSIGVVALVALLLFAPLSNYHTGLISYAAVLALLGLSVTLTLGYLGYISFGQAAFFGLGAYTAGLLTVNGVLSFWPAVLVAIVPGALLGSLVGYASLRVGGAYFAIATLTVGEILRLLALNWIELTRGPLGVMVPRPRIGMLDSMGLQFQQYYTVICVLCLVLALVALGRLLHSPWGRAWQAIREAPALAQSVGINTLRYRVVNTTLSGGLASLAGALLVPKILVLTPDLFSPMLSATALLVAIVGGVGSIVGPVLGGIVFSVFPEALRFIDQYRIAVFALLLLVIIRLQPGGIIAFVPKRWLPKAERSETGKEAVLFPQSEMKSDLAIANLGRSFGGVCAVQDVSFTIRPRELLGIIGPNGAGKTTCLTLVSGFAKPSEGEIRLGDRVLSGLAPHIVAGRGVVRTFQQALLCSELSVFENVLIGTHLGAPEGFFASLLQGADYREREGERAGRALHCLRLVGLEADVSVQASDLPYGEQKMLSIAVALAAGPSLLLLDEPAAGLNHTEAQTLSDLLKRLRDTGLTLVVVDHNLRMMMQLCDRIVVLHHGQKLTEGEPHEVRKDADVQRAYLGGYADFSHQHPLKEACRA